MDDRIFLTIQYLTCVDCAIDLVNSEAGCRFEIVDCPNDALCVLVFRQAFTVNIDYSKFGNTEDSV